MEEETASKRHTNTGKINLKSCLLSTKVKGLKINKLN
jgi:hypothetical protein